MVTPIIYRPHSDNAFSFKIGPPSHKRSARNFYFSLKRTRAGKRLAFSQGLRITADAGVVTVYLLKEDVQRCQEEEVSWYELVQHHQGKMRENVYTLFQGAVMPDIGYGRVAQ